MVIPTDPLSIATRYAELGYGVIPLRARAKVPHLAAWQRDFFTTPGQIDIHWGTHPSDGIGLVTGQRTGILVLDVDAKNGGLETVRAMLSEHGDLPDTVEARTGGGGSHYLFNYPVGRRIRSRAGIRPGIDIRAGFTDDAGTDQGAGQIAVFPTIHPDTGEQYRWVRAPWDSVRADAPPWLISLLEEPRTPKTPSSDGLVRPGERHGYLVSEAARLRNLGHAPDVIVKMLHVLYDDRCEHDPPMPDDEIEGIAGWFEGKNAIGLDSDGRLGGPPPGSPAPFVTSRDVTADGIDDEETAVLPFPIDVFPTRTWAALEEIHKGISVSIDFLGGAALALAASAIGPTRSLKPSETAIATPQKAILFSMIVSPPGSAKTEALDQLDRPVLARNQLLKEDFQQGYAEHKTLAEAWDLYKKERRDYDADRRKKTPQGLAEPTAPEAELGDAPRRPYAMFTEGTLEGVLKHNMYSPRGLIWVSNELSGFLRGLDQYHGNNGNDRSRILNAWDGKPVVILRGGDDDSRTLEIEHPFLNILGGLTPSDLREFRGRREDGFFDPRTRMRIIVLDVPRRTRNVAVWISYPELIRLINEAAPTKGERLGITFLGETRFGEFQYSISLPDRVPAQPASQIDDLPEVP